MSETRLHLCVGGSADGRIIKSDHDSFPAGPAPTFRYVAERPVVSGVVVKQPLPELSASISYSAYQSWRIMPGIPRPNLAVAVAFAENAGIPKDPKALDALWERAFLAGATRPGW